MTLIEGRKHFGIFKTQLSHQQDCSNSLVCWTALVSTGTQLQAVDWRRFKGTDEGMDVKLYPKSLYSQCLRYIYLPSKVMYQSMLCVHSMHSSSFATSCTAMSSPRGHLLKFKTHWIDFTSIEKFSRLLVSCLASHSLGNIL